MRATLAAVLLLAAGWTVSEYRRVSRQETIAPELVRAGTYVLLEEPTALGQLVRKFLPDQEPWLAERIGEGWFARQTVFVCHELTDEQAPQIAEQLQRLGTAREVQLRHARLSDAGWSAFEKALSGIAIVSADDSANLTYFRSRAEHEQFAFGGAMLASLIAVGLPVGTLLAGWWAARRLVPRFRPA